MRGSLFQNQREFYLQEQLKAIHRELGEDDGDDVAELEAQIEAKQLPEPVEERARCAKLRKLRRMSPLSPESTVARNFVDWIVALPWTERTDDVLDVAHARRVLDEDHYGLEEVKDRILDYIGVLSLVERLDGPILCLVGPPGVGKTSLGRSIARALGRKFVRMSLGGVRDEAEIRGHRRTYIGSMPGRVIQAMRRAEVVNPVILLDEIDKLGTGLSRRSGGGAARGARSRSRTRRSTITTSRSTTICRRCCSSRRRTSSPQIPEPLRDRMEIIRLSGYLDQEKLAIARQFLVPRQLEANGLDPATVEWSRDVLPAIVQRLHARGRRARARAPHRARRAQARARAAPSARASTSGADATPTTRRASTICKELLGSPPFDPDDSCRSRTRSASRPGSRTRASAAKCSRSR